MISCCRKYGLNSMLISDIPRVCLQLGNPGSIQYSAPSSPPSKVPPARHIDELIRTSALATCITLGHTVYCFCTLSYSAGSQTHCSSTDLNSFRAWCLVASPDPDRPDHVPLISRLPTLKLRVPRYYDEWQGPSPRASAWAATKSWRYAV